MSVDTKKLTVLREIREVLPELPDAIHAAIHRDPKRRISDEDRIGLAALLPPFAQNMDW